MCSLELKRVSPINTSTKNGIGRSPEIWILKQTISYKRIDKKKKKKKKSNTIVRSALWSLLSADHFGY